LIWELFLKLLDIYFDKIDKTGYYTKDSKKYMEEEVNLVDYLEVIIKHRWLILAIFGIIIVTAIILNLVAPKVYQGTAILEIGQIGTLVPKTGQVVSELIESPAELVEKINQGVYSDLVVGRKEKPLIRISSAVLGETSFIEVKIESTNKQLIRKALNNLNQVILKQHQLKVSAKQNILNDNIRNLEQKVNSLEQERKILEQDIQKLTGSERYALLNLLEVKKQEISETKSKINELKNALTKIESTKVIKSAQVLDRPIRPKVAQNLTISGILGLLIGVFAAFIKEWWKKSREASA